MVEVLFVLTIILAGVCGYSINLNAGWKQSKLFWWSCGLMFLTLLLCYRQMLAEGHF